MIRNEGGSLRQTTAPSGKTHSKPLLKTVAAHKSLSSVSGKPKIALALAGGGPLGAMYEIGVLMALDESLDGLDLNAMDIYVGVSAGVF